MVCCTHPPLYYYSMILLLYSVTKNAQDTDPKEAFSWFMIRLIILNLSKYKVAWNPRKIIGQNIGEIKQKKNPSFAQKIGSSFLFCFVCFLNRILLFHFRLLLDVGGKEEGRGGKVVVGFACLFWDYFALVFGLVCWFCGFF